MQAPTLISAKAKTQVGHRLSIAQNLLSSVETGNNNRHAISIAKILKEYSCRFDHALATKVSVPLGHISLAAELLQSLTADKDLQMCLDVITRNTIRINDLVQEFHTFKQTEETKSERHYILH
jgi:nitrogen-specific signal transduction histidine kinase